MGDSAFEGRGKKGEHYCEVAGMRHKHQARKLAAGASFAYHFPAYAAEFLYKLQEIVHTIGQYYTIVYTICFCQFAFYIFLNFRMCTDCIE